MTRLLAPMGTIPVHWDIAGNNVLQAVQDFIWHGKMLHKTKDQVIETRLISFPEVLYKGIKKILAERIKEVLDVIISPD